MAKNKSNKIETKIVVKVNGKKISKDTIVADNVTGQREGVMHLDEVNQAINVSTTAVRELLGI